MLGYPSALQAFGRADSRFGLGGGDIILDELKCTGTETSLFNCPHNGLWKHDCKHTEDASVVCESK